MNTTTTTEIINPYGNLRVYPNPVRDVLIIDACTLLSRLIISDLCGREVNSTEIKPAARQFLNLSSLPEGVYSVCMVN